MNTGVEFAQLWESSIPGIELFEARLFRHVFAKHMHEAYTLGLTEAGQGSYMWRGEIHRPNPGNFNLMSPGEIHTGQGNVDVGWTFRNIYISVSCAELILTQMEWEGRGLPHFFESVVCDESLQRSFYKLFQALNQPTSQLEQQSLLLEVLSQFFVKHAAPCRELRSPQKETKAIALTRAYLEAHYAENISIDALAQLVGLSPYYLIRSFHQQVGLPPHGYQQHWQLMQAKQALRTSKPLSEVAADHGFYDQSHLNRSFKRVFGITPGQYRCSFKQVG